MYEYEYLCSYLYNMSRQYARLQWATAHTGAALVEAAAPPDFPVLRALGLQVRPSAWLARRCHVCTCTQARRTRLLAYLSIQVMSWARVRIRWERSVVERVLWGVWVWVWVSVWCVCREWLRASRVNSGRAGDSCGVRNCEETYFTQQRSVQTTNYVRGEELLNNSR